MFIFEPSSLPEPLYVSFHDEEWGLPVYDDQKLFELLSLSAALSEFSWPTILNKREKFRFAIFSSKPSVETNGTFGFYKLEP